MSAMQQVAAWIAFVIGAGCSNVFIAMYLWRVRPWRRRDGEARAVKRVRADVLAWSGTATLLYDAGAVGLIVRHVQPDASAGQLMLKILVAALVAHRLLTYVRDVWEARP